MTSQTAECRPSHIPSTFTSRQSVGLFIWAPGTHAPTPTPTPGHLHSLSHVTRHFFGGRRVRMRTTDAYLGLSNSINESYNGAKFQVPTVLLRDRENYTHTYRTPNANQSGPEAGSSRAGARARLETAAYLSSWRVLTHVQSLDLEAIPGSRILKLSSLPRRKVDSVLRVPPRAYCVRPGVELFVRYDVCVCLIALA